MTASDISRWVNSTLFPKARKTYPNLPSITDHTAAVCWLHILGFEIMSSKKGFYIDGHEHSDVVDYRKIISQEIRNHFQLSCTTTVMCRRFLKDGLDPTVRIPYCFSSIKVFFTPMMIKAVCGEKS